MEEERTVQLDKSQFFKRNYNRGQLYPEQWVLGKMDL